MNSGYQVISGTANNDDSSGPAVALRKGTMPATMPVPMPSIQAIASAKAISTRVNRMASR
jgi:hypothetical protein